MIMGMSFLFLFNHTSNIDYAQDVSFLDTFSVDGLDSCTVFMDSMVVLLFGDWSLDFVERISVQSY